MIKSPWVWIHEKLTTGIHGVGANYIPAAPAASHLVRTFTKGWTSGKLVKGAGVDADPIEIVAPAGAVIGDSDTQTLTNKTLTSPAIQGTVGAGTGLTMPAFAAGGDITISSFIFGTDAGASVLVDLPISATPAAGTQESYSLKIDTAEVLRIYGEANGAGAVKNKMILLTQEATKPAAAAGYRGGFLLEPGAAGVADKLYCCMKSSTDTYNWIQVATG